MINNVAGFPRVVLLILLLGTSALFLGLQSKAWADVWRCKGDVYTSKKENSTCAPVHSARICGSEGNKYYVPGRSAYGPGQSEPCALTGKNQSPLVNLDYVRSLPKKEASLERKLKSPNSAQKVIGKDTKLEIPPQLQQMLGGLGTLGAGGSGGTPNIDPGMVTKIMECMNKSGSSDPLNCAMQFMGK